MTRRTQGHFFKRSAALGAAALMTLGLATGAHAQAAAQAAPAHHGTLTPRALAQIQALEQEENARLPYQRRLDSSLWYATRMSQGLAITRAVPTLRTGITPEADGLVPVDITADVTDDLLGVIKSAGGVVVSDFPQYRAVRARLPLRQMEYVAGQPGVQFIRPAMHAQIQGNPTAMFACRGSKFLLAPYVLPGASGGFSERADAVRAHLPGLVQKLNPLLTPNAGSGSVDSEGDTTHRAIAARSTYKVDGTGIKIGVISDSDDYLEASQASGNLPADVTVLAGQSGRPGTGEGTAMMEIVHDIAPGAKVYFSTCGDTEAQMAANIVALHNAGCQIIVDDIAFFDESPFQDGVVAKAVDTVTAAGAYYFSSATNNGNYDSGASGVWEGEFTDSGNHYSGGIIHSFKDIFGTPVTEDTLSDGRGSGQEVNLFWSDPLGKSRNDYNLYAVDGSNNVVAAATDPQTGTQDPFEYLPSVADGESLVVVLHSGVAKYLHLDCGTQHGYLTDATAGRTRGHNSVNAVGAYGVAATPASLDQYGNAAGPYPKSFNKSDVVEDFSSDGPREQFYDKNGAAVPNGGLILLKPDITAADGVTTSLNQATVGDGNETFAPFFGTSAAAPHAAAITGLLLSYAPALTQAQVRTLLTSTTTDIMTTGWDQDSVGSSRVDLQACKLEYSIVSPK